MTVTELQTLRDALVKALAGGYRALTIGDKRIEYQSAEEMQRALATIDNEIAVASGKSPVRTTFVSFR